ncbi:hypothetical protein B0H14DRAFT_2594517 [Mycena olivaceomarginata]|nr:hypothetical protein B0H14DRAFT_2594517 [Mycena olivaceomarginata]
MELPSDLAAHSRPSWCRFILLGRFFKRHEGFVKDNGAWVVKTLLRDIPDLGFFFFTTQAKESLEGMLSSTLLQLASGQAGQERRKILLQVYTSDKHMGTPDLAALLAYFKMILEVPRDLVLVVDALDEHPRPRDQLLRFLTNLSRNHRVRMLVASRAEDDIRVAMQNIGATEVDLYRQGKQREDVYSQSHQGQAWPGKHLDALRYCMPIDVEDTLASLPGSLVEMYDCILQLLEKSNPKTAQRVKRVLEMIFVASRPLTVHELAEVFVVRFDERNSVQISETDRLKDPARQLVQMCSSALIRIQEYTVHFAHASVPQYLDSSRTNLYSIDPASAEMTLAKLCLGSILSTIRSSAPGRQAGPLDGYAQKFWLKDTPIEGT